MSIEHPVPCPRGQIWWWGYKDFWNVLKYDSDLVKVDDCEKFIKGQRLLFWPVECYQVASRTLAVTGLFWNSCGRSWLIWYCNTIPACHFGCVTHNVMLLITYTEPFFFLSSTSNRILIESYQVYGFAWSQSFLFRTPCYLTVLDGLVWS